MNVSLLERGIYIYNMISNPFLTPFMVVNAPLVQYNSSIPGI